jgi:hypothetical protein
MSTFRFPFYKAMAAITAAPIIPAPTLKPLPALVVTVAGADEEAFEVDEEDDAVPAAAELVEDEAVVVAEAADETAEAADDVALETTEAAEEAADETADDALEAAEVAVLEAPPAVARAQI